MPGSGEKTFLTVIVGVLAVVAFVLAFCHTSVPAGTVHVVTYWGGTSGELWEPGWVWKWPQASSHEFCIQDQEVEFKNIENTLSLDQLYVWPDFSVIYYMEKGHAIENYNTIENHGDYFSTYLEPLTLKFVREQVKVHKALEITDINVSKSIEASINASLNKELNPYGVHVKYVLLRGVKLPKKIVDVTEEKVAEQSRTEQARQGLKTQELVNERVVSSAKAQAQANREISGSLSELVVQNRLIDVLPQMGGNGAMMFFNGIGGAGSTGNMPSLIINPAGMAASTAKAEDTSKSSQEQNQPESVVRSSDNTDEQEPEAPGFEGVYGIAAFAVIAGIFIFGRRRR